ADRYQPFHGFSEARTMRYRFCLIIFVLGFQAGDVLAQDQELSAWIEQVRPELEKILGYSLPKLPLIQSGSLARQPDPEVAVCVNWRWPDFKQSSLQGQFGAQAAARALEDAQAVNDSASVARLIEATNVILIRRENQKVIAGWDQVLAKAQAPDFF